MIETNSQLKQMYWLDGKWVYVDAENANNLDKLDSTDFASSITEKRVDQSSSHMSFGNNDWSKMLYSISTDAVLSAQYNSANQGMGFTGVNKKYGIATHIPIDPESIYNIKVKVKKVSGDGNFSLGVQGLDNTFNVVGDAKLVVANNTSISTTATLSAKISGYGISATQFTSGSNYFDIVFYTGQNGSNASTVYVIQSIEIVKIQNELYVGNQSVWHEGNFTPTDKADLSYVNSELSKRDTSINTKLDNSHASVIGATSLGHVKNGGNVTIASDGKMNTSPSAIGAYTKAEADAAIDVDIATHATVIAQTNLGHVKNGGNVTVAPDGKVNTSPSAIGAYTKTETDDLIAVKLTDKAYVDAHIADSVKHVTAAERTKWNAKAEATGSVANNFSAKTLTIAGNILPTSNSTQTIGSSTNRFKAIYVDEAYLSTNTLYIGDIPIIGTEADTVNIKTDPDQSICMKTSATGTTTVTSEKAVAITTSGMNSNVTIQTTGTNSQTNIAATSAVNVNAPKINLTGSTTVDGDLTAKSLTVTGNFTIGGALTTVNTENLVISDNIIDINKGETGQGVSEGMAGIKIDRGDLSDVLLVFDETDDKFKVGETANLLPLATEKYVYDNRYIHPGSGTNPHGTTKADVGLGNVTNESKATMFTSPAFTGTPTAPTPTSGTSTTQLATTAFVMTEVNKKANTSHGNHVPTTETADNYKYLRNDNTWQTIPSASTSQKGIVQLNNNVNSTATDQAATAAAVKTTYDLAASKASTSVATISANGLMSASDKAKLDAIASGAGANQNAFSYVKVGTTTVAADSITDTFELVAGTGITLTADATTDKITISGVNQYTHPTGDGNSHIPANGTTNSGKYLQATAAAGTYKWASLPTASTTTAGIIQIGTGATNAAAGNHSHSYLPLSGGTLTGTLVAPSLKLNLGEGLEFLSEENYFGTNLDARIIRAIDNNGTAVDGGIVFEGYGINGTTTTRTEWLVMRQDVFTWKGNKIYHAGNKPTPADIGAAASSHTHSDYSLTTHNHDSVYQKKQSTTFDLQTSYVAVRTSGRTAAQYYEFWDSGIGWADIKAGEFYANGNKVYHTGNKPTPADIGAAASSHTHSYLPLSGGTLTGALIAKADQYFFSGNGAYAINLKNSDIIGANCIVFNDESDSVEGLCWPKAGKTGSSISSSDYDILKSYQSYLYYNTNKVYHEGFKPTPADIGAAASSHTHSYLPLSGGTLTGNITMPNSSKIYFNASANYLGVETSTITLSTCSILNLIADNDNSSTTEHVNIKAGNGTGIKVYKDRSEFNEKIVAKKEINMGSSSQAGIKYNETTECIEFYFA